MPFSLMDFLTGVFLMNAMAHTLFGVLQIRFLSAFGYTPKANLAWALCNLLITATLFHLEHGIQQLPQHGTILGALAVLLIFLLVGQPLHQRFQR